MDELTIPKVFFSYFDIKGKDRGKEWVCGYGFVSLNPLKGTSL